MWVAVLIMCQLYQVRLASARIAEPFLYLPVSLFTEVWLVFFRTFQIAALGITTNERMNARRYKHFKVTATSIESPFK